MQSVRQSGFTLIEIMIVVAIVAILAAIALPAFADQMRKGRRAEAVAALQDAQLRLERWRTDHADFKGSGVTITDTSHYDYTVTAVDATATTPAGYTISAAPLGGQGKDVCKTLKITNSGGTIKKEPTDASCW